jgi:membrane protein implicated in regulation of membrane protease activity
MLNSVVFNSILVVVYWALVFFAPLALAIFTAAASTLTLLIYIYMYLQNKKNTERQLADTLYRLQRLLK